MNTKIYILKYELLNMYDDNSEYVPKVEFSISNKHKTMDLDDFKSYISKLYMEKQDFNFDITKLDHTSIDPVINPIEVILDLERIYEEIIRSM